ncbi:protein rep [Bacillus thuringiensis]|uniref:Replication protein n=1 Tax=Bacillus thuringiensis serovar kumamotoensis TaxID=132267 RepID=A0A9X6JR24_BACUK|nr:protein rep [Bacillus thuringiensis]OTZ71058.1 replication protein [Bacillus thuringiensis serovar kumamtoensis]
MEARNLIMLSSWERSLELAYFNHRVITEINKTQQVNWLLIDLGLENVNEEDINETLDRMLIAFNRLFKYKSVRQIHLGYFRMLDILKKGDRYHPRIHILVPMIKSYFQGKYYIKHDGWSSLWSRALGMEKGLYVKVKVMKAKEERCEIPHEKLLNFREQESEFSYQESKVITSRRLVGYSKLLKAVTDQLINGNISHFDMDKFCIDDSIANQVFINMLQWHPGLREDEKSPFVK